MVATRDPGSRVLQRLRLTTIRVLLIASAVLGVACGQRTSDPGDFWRTLQVSGAAEVEHYATLGEMASQADAVVLGTFRGFGETREVQGDAQEDVVFYASASLAVSKLLDGKDFGSILPLEFMVPASTADEASRVISDLESDLPTGEVVVFVREKDGAESGHFRAVNSLGLWAETERAELDTPLAEEAPDEGAVYRDELEGVGSVEELAGLIESFEDRAVSPSP